MQSTRELDIESGEIIAYSSEAALLARPSTIEENIQALKPNAQSIAYTVTQIRALNKQLAKYEGLTKMGCIVTASLALAACTVIIPYIVFFYATAETDEARQARLFLTAWWLAIAWILISAGVIAVDTFGNRLKRKEHLVLPEIEKQDRQQFDQCLRLLKKMSSLIVEQQINKDEWSLQQRIDELEQNKNKFDVKGIIKILDYIDTILIKKKFYQKTSPQITNRNYYNV